LLHPREKGRDLQGSGDQTFNQYSEPKAPTRDNNKLRRVLSFYLASEKTPGFAKTAV